MGLAIGLISIGGVIFSVDDEDYFVIGITSWVANEDFDNNIEGFKQSLEKFGFIEGKNVKYIIKNPNGNEFEQKRIIQSFIDNEVDLIYSLTTPGTLIAKQMTEDIPIVFSIVTYPQKAGLIETYENSGNNLVGTRNFIPAGKQFDVFYDIFQAKKIGFLHRDGEPNSIFQFDEMRKHAEKINVEIIEINPKSIEDTESKILNIINEIDAIYQACDTLVQSGGEEIAIKIATEHNKPTFSCNKDGVKKGALIGDVVDFKNIGVQSGEKAALILQGVNPSEIISESQKGDYIIVNLQTAKVLGIKIPQYILNISEEVIGG